MPKCPGFFYVHYTTHGTYSFTSHPKDEAITVKCLAQGHKRRDRPARDSNPTFWQHQNLSPMHETARPQHSILCHQNVGSIADQDRGCLCVPEQETYIRELLLFIQEYTQIPVRL